jgi:hypothetical protein
LVWFFLCVPHTVFLACEIIFYSKSDCEIVRKPAFGGLPRTSQARQYQIPSICPHLFFIYFQAMPSKNHASRKQANVYKDASKTHANQNRAMQCPFRPVSTSVRKRGIIPEIAIFVETRKYDPYIPIITYRR